MVAMHPRPDRRELSDIREENILQADKHSGLNHKVSLLMTICLMHSVLSISGGYGCTSGRYSFGRYGQLFTIAGTQPAIDICEFRRTTISKFAMSTEKFRGVRNSGVTGLGWSST